jgi:lysylphosphatidylglycerol synthetase-like protein (DUF2156 family)
VRLARDILLFFHLVGFAALLGGAVVQLGDRVKVVNAAMLRGALTVVVSGLALVGVLEGLDDPVDRPKVVAKFAVALVIGLLCWANRSRSRVPRGLFGAIVLLILGDLAISVPW